MNKASMTDAILTAKRTKSLTWPDIAAAAGLSEVFTTSACLGENALDATEAGRIGALLDLSPEAVAALTDYAEKGSAAPSVSKEPLQYRFQEILYVYGRTLKELIEEKFGPGIMSAIDFTMDIEKVPDPKGDRVRITMNGKFLGYKKW
jgi:cyanate lyase